MKTKISLYLILFWSHLTYAQLKLDPYMFNNITGKLIKQIKIDGPETIISNELSGLFFAKFFSKEGSSSVIKILN